jgi:hypothetical protein
VAKQFSLDVPIGRDHFEREIRRGDFMVFPWRSELMLCIAKFPSSPSLVIKDAISLAIVYPWTSAGQVTRFAREGIRITHEEGVSLLTLMKLKGKHINPAGPLFMAQIERQRARAAKVVV